MKKITMKGLFGCLALGIVLATTTTAIDATELNEDVMEASVSDNEMIPELAIGETYDGLTVKSVTVDKSEVVAGETLTLEIQVESEKELYDYANYDITDAHEKIDVFKTLMESAINLWNLTKNLKVKK